MASIATKRGDQGQTNLAGGVRVSKSSIRVESYGTIDELNSVMGFARSICENQAINNLVKQLQKELFAVGSSLATPPNSKKLPPAITQVMVDNLTTQVHKIEAMEGILADWSIAGEHATSAAFDMARTVCRRAERNIMHLLETGEEINPHILPYVNRLSDLLWLVGRWIELEVSIDASLRDEDSPRKTRWSRAWK